MLEANRVARRLATLATLMTLVACGGGGDGGTSGAPAPTPAPSTSAPAVPTPSAPTPPAPTPPVPTGFGSLTVTGPGAANLNGDFTPTLISITPTFAPPVCDQTFQGTLLCTSGFTTGWIGPTGQLGIGLLATNIPSPGAVAGTQINTVVITLGTAAARFEFNCTDNVVATTCSVAGIGVTLDPTQRTLTFVDTVVPSVPAGNGITLNGTLKY